MGKGKCIKVNQFDFFISVLRDNLAYKANSLFTPMRRTSLLRNAVVRVSLDRQRMHTRLSWRPLRNPSISFSTITRRQQIFPLIRRIRQQICPLIRRIRRQLLRWQIVLWLENLIVCRWVYWIDTAQYVFHNHPLAHSSMHIEEANVRVELCNALEFDGMRMMMRATGLKIRSQSCLSEGYSEH